MEEKYIKMILELSKKAVKKKEVPVSAIIVMNNKVIAKAINRRNKKHSITDHAEIIVLNEASKKIKDWRLNECDLYVTLKPCKMCEAAINQSRIKNVYYILEKLDNKKEYNKTKYSKANICTIENEYKEILRAFFQKKRDKR